MIAEKYTPGPWSVHQTTDQMNFEDTTICRIKFSGQDTDLFIGSPATNHGDAMATAKLIAAAPELLQALMEFLSAFQGVAKAECESIYSFNQSARIKVLRASIKAEAAINKATI